MPAVGTIGLALLAAGRARTLHASDVAPACAAAFAESQRQLSAADGARATYRTAAAAHVPDALLLGAHVIVVDPPRRGLEPELVARLCQLPARGGGCGGGGAPAAEAAATEAPSRPRRLLYLSCGFDALRRDADELLASGGWRIAAARAYSFFPGTDSIETLALFEQPAVQASRQKPAGRGCELRPPARTMKAAGGTIAR